jgi:hypothetical protein
MLARMARLRPGSWRALGHKTPKFVLNYCRPANQKLLGDEAAYILNLPFAKRAKGRAIKAACRSATLKVVQTQIVARRTRRKRSNT